MRGALRHRRTWLALAAAVAAPWLASRDNRTGWTVLVTVVTSSLAVASIWVEYDATHPDRAARRAAKQEERVRAILYEYQQTGAHRLSRAERKQHRQRAEVERILRRYEQQRAAGRPAKPARQRRRGRQARQQGRVEDLLARYEGERAGAPR